MTALFHQAWRRLVRRPVVLVLMVSSLGVGVGINLTLYAVVKQVAFRDSPATFEPERLMTVTPGLSYPDYLDVSGQSTAADYAIFQSATLLWARERDTRPLGAKIVSPDYFEVLGVRPVLGRSFAADPHNPDQVLVSYQFWQQHFGSDVAIIGRPLTINGWPMTIVGVLPHDFYSAVAPLLAPAIYVPVSPHVNLALDARGAAQFDVVARLRRGTTFAQGVGELRALDKRQRQAYPDIRRGQPLSARPRVVNSFQAVSGDDGLQLLLLTVVAAVTILGGLVLLITCANVAGVLAARADERRRDLAIRAAIGADRRRLFLELFAEGLLLGAVSVAGAVAIWTVASWSLPQIQSMANLSAFVMPPPMPFGFAIALMLLVAAASTMAPAILAGRIDPVEGLRITTGQGGMRGRLSIPRMLVALQVAICAIFIAAAVFVVRTTTNLSALAPGFDVSRTAVVSVRFPSALGNTATLDLERQLRQIAGVISVSYGTLPSAFSSGRNQVRLDATGQSDLHADALRVAPEFLDTLGVSIEHGRNLRDGDQTADDAVRPIVIDQTFAERYLQHRDPIGLTLTLGGDTESGIRDQRAVIVGVSRRASLVGPEQVPTPVIFVPSDPPLRSATVLVRTGQRATVSVPAIIRVLGTRFPGASASVMPLAEQFAGALAPLRVALVILGLLAAIGTVVAMVGLHGLASYEISRRTFDIGVHRALGASTISVIGLVLRQVAVMVGGGILAGVSVAGTAGRLLPPIAGTHALAPIDMAGAAGILTLTTITACMRPALNASRIEAIIALKAE